MANLGFQAVLRHLVARPGVAVERAFLPDERPHGRVRSLETERPPSPSFDIVAFSISFETDYLHVVDILPLAGPPLRRRSGRRIAPLSWPAGPRPS